MKKVKFSSHVGSEESDSRDPITKYLRILCPTFLTKTVCAKHWVPKLSLTQTDAFSQLIIREKKTLTFFMGGTN